MLRKIHKTHQGPTSSLRRAREVLFWPEMSADIRQTFDACGVCAKFQVDKPKKKKTIQSHAEPELPRATIILDVFQLEGKNDIVTVDHYSDFIELDYLKNITANLS